jgi:Holliday junction resolvasome RuvABC DNA-binding subunit
VFGDEHIDAKRAERERNDTVTKVHKALRKLGFSEPEVRLTLADLKHSEVANEPEALLRAALSHLVPGTR